MFSKMSQIFPFMCLATCMSLLFLGCSDRTEPDGRSATIRISPSIHTRVSGLYFETGDCIGLTIAPQSGSSLENIPLTYRDTYFTNEALTWGDLGGGPATFTAYYPHTEEGLSGGFSVAADQRGGYAPSDLLGAVAADVAPTSGSVEMLFYHLLSQLNIVVNNDTSASVTQVVVSGFVSEAEVDLPNLTATASPSAVASEVTAFEETAGEMYRVILVPQRASLTVRVETSDGATRSKTLSDAALEGGRRYNLSLQLTDEQLDVALSGEIGDWVDGGSLIPDDPGGEDDPPGGGETPDGDLVYEGETYATADVGGVTWMAENYRYVPDASMIGRIIWYPGGDPGRVAEQGLLYSLDAAVNGSSADAAERVRGICPPGWHLPSLAELEALVAVVPADFITDTGYYNGASYLSTGTSILIGGERSGSEMCWAVKKKEGVLSVVSIQSDYGMSMRCVKD